MIKIIKHPYGIRNIDKLVNNSIYRLRFPWSKVNGNSILHAHADIFNDLGKIFVDKGLAVYYFDSNTLILEK